MTFTIPSALQLDLRCALRRGVRAAGPVLLNARRTCTSTPDGRPARTAEEHQPRDADPRVPDQTGQHCRCRGHLQGAHPADGRHLGLDAYEEYCKSLNKLSGLLKRFETEVGLYSGDYAMWKELIAAREEVKGKKARVLSLESRLHSVTGLLEAMAQTTFANGAEYAGVCMNERLLSAEREIKTAAKKTASLEDVLNRAHRDAVLSILGRQDGRTGRGASSRKRSSRDASFLTRFSEDAEI
ncbi:uncharacterized protein LOC144149697 isoform X1 [Haemaphysalis longicornis]